MAKKLKMTLNGQIEQVQYLLDRHTEDLKYVRKPNKKRAINDFCAFLQDVINSLKELKQLKESSTLQLSSISNKETVTDFSC